MLSQALSKYRLKVFIPKFSNFLFSPKKEKNVIYDFRKKNEKTTSLTSRPELVVLLNLSMNALKSMEQDTFKVFTNLRSLDASLNEISR